MGLFKKHLDYRGYWEKRYSTGGNSGAGSYGEHAAYKASVVNRLIEQHGIHSILELGCGDGNQLGLLEAERYVGVDISRAAVDRCRNAYAHDHSKQFMIYAPREHLDLGMFDMTLSLEVLMHVIDEADYVATVEKLFAHSSNLVVILAPLFPLLKYERGSHERHRELMPYLRNDDFELVEQIIHPSVTLEQRREGEIGQMSSDFVVLRRKK